MELCYVALGANLGSPQEHIRTAYHLISAHPHIYAPRCAPLYETAPVSPIPQPFFINTVCCFQTTLPPLVLFDVLESIERRLGKVPKPKENPRLIDLDLLFYGEHVHCCERLTLPHPKWHERLFVLHPLADLTEDFDVHRRLRNLYRENAPCPENAIHLLKSSPAPASLKASEPPWKLLNG